MYCGQMHIDKLKAGRYDMKEMNELIKKFEGFSPVAYYCQAHKLTIGYGTTEYPDGKPVKKGDTITEEKAEALLNDYLIKNVRPKIADLRLKPNQQEALESLIYNIGWGAFSKSSCYKAIKNKDWESVFKNWDWIKGGGKFLLGLAKRRAEELDLFFKDL